LQVFCQARLVSGFELLAEMVNLEDQIARADCVVTGEGWVDATSLQGKTVGRLRAMAAAYGKPCHVICGGADANLPNDLFASLTCVSPQGPQDTLEKNTSLLRQAAQKVAASVL
jgi:glycerate kinase